MVLALGSAQLTAQTAPASSTGRALGGALAGAALGALAGGVAGAWIGGNKCADEGNPDSCYLIAGTAIGLTVGVTVGAPVGAHLMNRRLGSLPTSLLVSTAIAAVGVAAFRHVDRKEPGSARTAQFNTILIGVPVLQVLGAGLIESRTGRR